MRNLDSNVIDDMVLNPQWQTKRPATRPSFLHLITSYDVEIMRHALRRATVPPDFLAKLGALAEGNLASSFIQQHCQTMLALLMAAQEGSFLNVSQSEQERLLRVLAYVRKDDDAIPDYSPNGFSDDQQEVRAVITEFAPLLGAFKEWRLRHQVPVLWQARLQNFKKIQRLECQPSKI
jgi:hypothetical protein